MRLGCPSHNLDDPHVLSLCQEPTADLLEVERLKRSVGIGLVLVQFWVSSEHLETPLPRFVSDDE